jgi:hypothetical protein
VSVKSRAMVPAFFFIGWLFAVFIPACRQAIPSNKSRGKNRRLRKERLVSLFFPAFSFPSNKGRTAKTRGKEIMNRPEGYNELSVFLDRLTAQAWKGILSANRLGGYEAVIQYLREECKVSLSLWSDEELTDYLSSVSLTADFNSVDERF